MEPYRSFFHEYRMMHRPFISKLNEHLAKYQLYNSQWGILLFLTQEGAHSLVEISNYMYVEKPTTTRMVQKLMELDYVTTVPGKDKREKLVQLTVLGEKACTEMQITIDQYLINSLEGISNEECAIASKVLAKVRENILK